MPQPSAELVVVIHKLNRRSALCYSCTRAACVLTLRSFNRSFRSSIARHYARHQKAIPVISLCWRCLTNKIALDARSVDNCIIGYFLGKRRRDRGDIFACRKDLIDLRVLIFIDKKIVQSRPKERSRRSPFAEHKARRIALICNIIFHDTSVLRWWLSC